MVSAVRWTCEKYIVRGELFGFERIEILVVVMYVVKAKLPEMFFDFPCAIVWVPNAEVFFRFANPLGELDEERCDVTIRLSSTKSENRRRQRLHDTWKHVSQSSAGSCSKGCKLPSSP